MSVASTNKLARGNIAVRQEAFAALILFGQFSDMNVQVT